MNGELAALSTGQNFALLLSPDGEKSCGVVESVKPPEAATPTSFMTFSLPRDGVVRRRRRLRRRSRASRLARDVPWGGKPVARLWLRAAVHAMIFNGGSSAVSLRLSMAAVRTYDQLKQRAGTRRRSDARDPATVAAVERRLHELVGSFRLHAHHERSDTFLFWTDVREQIDAGSFDDLLDRL